MKAGQAGRLLLFHQNHRHALGVRQFFLKAFDKKNIQKTKRFLGDKAFDELLLYAGKFLDQCGPYGVSNRKYYLQKVDVKRLETLLGKTCPSLSAKSQREITLLLTDPSFEARAFPESSDGEGLESCGGNLYAPGIRGPEVKQALEQGLKIGLNRRVVRAGKKLKCETHTTESSGVVGTALRAIVKSLQSATKHASTEHQAEELRCFIRYFQTGNIEDFRRANIAWVKDRDRSSVDFMIGWVEIYEDWLAQIATWESYVQIVDPEVSKMAARIASFAQYFENAMPYENCFKKSFPEKYSPPALMVYFFHERSTMRVSGYNLPNFDDIRRDVGAKNIIKLPIPGEDKDPDYRAVWSEVIHEFMPADRVAPLLKHREKLWRILVLLHEIIGHGSGTYDVTEYGPNQDPVAGLGGLGIALEEQRSDLAALIFAGDTALVKAGIYQTEAEAKEIRNLMYDFVLGDFLRRLSGQRTFVESHQRGHWLFINKLLEQKAIGWVSRDRKSAPNHQNQVLAVLDYELFYRVSHDLLGLLQEIKARRLLHEQEELFKKYAPLDSANEPWAEAIVRRGEPLLINAGYVEQPWKISPRLNYVTMGESTLESIAPFWGECF